jgi:hypothetical protein
MTVGYAAPFRSRAAELKPGQLVALTPSADASGLIVWRWFDAVVLGSAHGTVRLWEPAHGEVLATPRRPDLPYRTGGRAYASAGLPGADWWVAGPADVAPEAADVELDEVRRFYDEHKLWSSVP